MDLAKVPIVPQWNLSSCCVATPDGGFLYIGSKTVNYISRVNDETPPIIKVFHIRQQVCCLAVDPAWMSCATTQTKYFALVAQDGCVQIWDFDKACVVNAHKAHVSKQSTEGNGPRIHDKVLLSYMCNRNVLSVGCYDMAIYCVASNSYCRRTTFISTRNQSMTVLRCSPFDENIFAVGTNRGLVLVCDLHQMRIIYTLRGHEAPITALSWTAVQKQVPLSPPKKRQLGENETTDKKIEPLRKKSGTAIKNDVDDIFDIYDYDYLDNEFGAPTKDEKSKGELPEFVGIEKTVDTGTTINFDFVEACENLKEDIVAKQQYSDEDPERNEVTLKDCQQVENKENLSSSCGEEDSTQGTLDLLSRSSDEDINIDGLQPMATDSCLKNSLVQEAQQIVHTAEVHSSHAVEQHLGPANSDEALMQEAIVCATESSEQYKEETVITEEVDRNSSNHGLDRDILLASASNDATFYVWNTETGGACDHQRARVSGHQRKNNHIEIMWLRSTSFLTTNRLGEITLWNMVPCERKIMSYKFKEDQRQFVRRNVANFSVCPDNETIWTISSHRVITCENVENQSIIAKYCCASTNISVMRECPDNMNKIALGFSDRRIGILDTSNLSSTNISIENYTTRIESPVFSLVWSPDSKQLAFGTNEGNVGVLNIESSKLQPHTYHPFCGKPIYSMDWQENYIYVVCNQKLGVYEESATSKDAEVIHSIKNISAISVRKGFLFVGTQRGHLQVYSRKPEQKLAFDLIQDLDLASRYITDIAWSSIATEQFAVISMANTISILNFNEGSPVDTPVRTIEIKNPKASNACLKWSNCDPNKFLTCGFDGAVRVWDISCNRDDEKFLKQFHCPMMCGLFLPSDENIIVCAGKATSVEFFNMKMEMSEDYSPSKWLRLNANTLQHVQWALEMPTRSDTKPTAAKKRRERSGKGKTEVEQQPQHPEQQGDRPDERAVSAVGTIDGNISTERSVIEEHKDEVACMMDNLKIDSRENEGKSKTTEAVGGSVFMKISTTLMYLTTKEINQHALEKLIYILQLDHHNQHLAKSIATVKLFSEKTDAKELLEEELRNLQSSQSKGIANLLIPQLQYNYKDEVLKCIRNKELTEWHVSMAPSISYTFWQNCCQAFAEQLLEQGYTLQAATYMIAIHHQTEAISMLLDHNYFKEALLVARLYLQPEDPLLHSIPNQWISYLDFRGNFAGAALICALSGQINRAYEILSKVRNMQPDVERALEMLKIKKSFSDP